MRLVLRLAASSVFASLLLFPAAARADDDCPPGSVHKTQDGFTWCEPTVCTQDGQCKDSEVCRPISLCMEVGTLANAATDGGKRLVVTQRCAPDKTCPQTQTCSALSRCISKTAAQKMGLLDVASASSATPAAPAKKSSCGCDVVGTRSTSAGGVALALGLSLVALRRRRDVSRLRGRA